MADHRSPASLQSNRRAARGRLKIYLGYAAGVGKSYQMLVEAHRLKNAGTDVAVGFIEPHGRADIFTLIEGLAVIPRRKLETQGGTVEEMDVDAVLGRHPQVVLIDELAHTNAAGSRNAKRYQDVQDILAAGIHVISTLNVQHLESLYNTVENLIGVKVGERIPDSVLAESDEVVNIDLTAEDLQHRLKEGKIYPADPIAASLETFFTSSNLDHLRELTLRETASQLDFRRRELATAQATAGATAIADKSGHGAPDQIMVCLSSRGPHSARLLRFGSRLAGRLNRNWYAVYVQTPSEEPTVIDARTQRLLADTLDLAKQLGATVFEFRGQDVADTILRFAREYRVGQIVIGRPRPIAWWKRLAGRKSVAEELILNAEGVTVIVADADADAPSSNRSTAEGPATVPAPIRVAPASSAVVAPAAPLPGSLSQLLGSSRVIIWEDPISSQEVKSALVKSIVANTAGLTESAALAGLAEREKLGSTFLNEGVALPHARVAGLESPQVALGLTHAGILDAPTDRPIDAMFVLLSPNTGAAVHLQLLAKVGRALQSRDLRRALSRAATSADVLDAIGHFEATSSGKAA